MIKKAHTGPSQASRAPTVRRSSVALLHRQALQPGQEGHEFLRGVTEYPVPVPKSVRMLRPACVGDNNGDDDRWRRGPSALCEYFGNHPLNGASTAEAQRPLCGVRFVRRLKTSELPLSQLALAGFTRLHPNEARDPATWADAYYLARKKTTRCILRATAVLLRFHTDA